MVNGDQNTWVHAERAAKRLKRVATTEISGKGMTLVTENFGEVPVLAHLHSEHLIGGSITPFSTDDPLLFSNCSKGVPQDYVPEELADRKSTSVYENLQPPTKIAPIED